MRRKYAAKFRPGPRHQTFGQCVTAALQASCASQLKEPTPSASGTETLVDSVKPPTSVSDETYLWFAQLEKHAFEVEGIAMPTGYAQDLKKRLELPAPSISEDVDWCSPDLTFIANVEPSQPGHRGFAWTHADYVPSPSDHILCLGQVQFAAESREKAKDILSCGGTCR